jgi:hypothetical protein
MRVSCEAGFPSVFSFEEGSMTKLETLELNFGKNQKSIEGVEHLKKLKEVHLLGMKDNPTLKSALEHLKEDSDGRSNDNNQFVVGVKYYR